MKKKYKFKPKKYIKYGDYFNLEYKLKEHENALKNNEIKGEKIVNLFAFLEYSLIDRNYNEKMETWLKLFPNSYYSHLANAIYWSFLAWDLRGNGYSDTIKEDNYLPITFCHEMSLIHLVRALNLTDNKVYLCHLIINSIAAFGSPEWLDEQINNKDSRFFYDRNIDWIYDQPEGESVSIRDFKHILPEIRPALPFDLPEIKEDDFKLYWFKIGLASGTDNISLIHTYFHFLKPRWGGSYEEMYNFIESEFCKNLNKKQKLELERTIYLDKEQGQRHWLIEIIYLPFYKIFLKFKLKSKYK